MTLRKMALKNCMLSPVNIIVLRDATT